MQAPPPLRGGTGPHPGSFAFEAKLEDEEELLDAMLAATTRAPLPDEAWEKLHAAALRDDRLSELAFGFESASQGKRLKTVPPAVAAEFLFQAARFFGEVFGDELGAVTYLERALVLLPGHLRAFALIEQLLEKAGQPRKLADVYAAAAQHRPRAEQAPLLKRGAQLLLEAGGADEKVIELLLHVLRLEPGDEDSRARLEGLYVKANRLRDVVRLNEQALAAEPPPEERTRKMLLMRIIELYEARLHEPERAMPHIEQLLGVDPANAEARRVAQKLLVIKGLAGRAAAALAQASESSGTAQDIARYLSIELESTRGPRRALLLARMGKLKSERMGDDKGAMEAFEQALAVDGSDDDLRARYVALASKQSRFVDAAKALQRVLATVKDPAVKAKASVQLGEMFLRGNEARRAKATLAGVLAATDAPVEATLAAAHLLRDVHAAENDGRALADVLERIASLEPDPGKRREADEALAALATEMNDTPRAIAAYERLLPTEARAQALAALAPLYEASGDPEKHARLLEEQAWDEADPAIARRQMMRAAEVRATSLKDPGAAIASCRAVVERFGPGRDVLALLVPLLEAEKQWPELAQALEQEASLLAGAEHAAAMARLGVLRMQRLRDVDGAIAAFDEALALDAAEKTARATLEKLASLGDHRLPAVRVLEPIYRREGATGPLLKLLELRGALAESVEERLGALREAADLAVAVGATEAARAVEVVGRGLAEAVAGEQPLREWLERLDRVAGAGTDAKKRAGLLSRAIGDREVTGDEGAELVRKAGEAHAAAGDAVAAIALYRRALAFEPHSAELLARIDDLLRDQGSPRERVALYRAAIPRSSAERRRELLHRIGAIEGHDLGDLAAATATYRTALEDDADDADAYTALEELYEKSEQWSELGALLEARLTRVDGDAARTTRARLAEVTSQHGDEGRARSLCARLLEDAELAPAHLDEVERAAERLGDVDLARAVLHRRAEMSEDPREQIGWLDRLGELDEDRRGDLEAAATTWKRAGALAEATGDEETARRLYARARKVAPDDRDVALHLVALHERAELWPDLPRLYAALGALATDDAERVDLWMKTARVVSEKLGDFEAAARRAALAFEAAPGRPDVLATFERLSVAAKTVDAFEHALDEALSRLDSTPSFPPEQRTLLLLARARALAGDPARADDAARAYRAILADARVARAAQADVLSSFEALVQGEADSPRRRGDRRWLLEWRAEHAPEEERIARLLEWAGYEETTFGDPVHALALHRRVLALDPESDEACVAVARLALATGDTEEALGALAARRDRAEGPARIAVELEIAQVLLSRTTRWRDALGALRAVLAEAPGDPTARALAAQLLAHRNTRADAIVMLEGACDLSDDLDVRAQILTRLLDAPADADDATARRVWFERLCDLQRDQGSVEAALSTAARAAREMPDVPPLWDRIEQLARVLRRPDEVAALYEEVLARSLGRDQALAIGERAVQFYEEWFEDSGRVVRILERVLELDPAADWAFDRLKLLLDSAERWDDLFALYDRALASASGKKRSNLLEDAAQTAKDFADRPDRAIQYLEQLHELRPGDPKLTGALERLYERQGRHRELVALLAERIPTLKRDEARRTRTRVAGLWLDELGDAGAALEAIEPLLQRPEDGANGASADVWALLERILAAAPASLDSRRSSGPPSTSGDPQRVRPARAPEPPRTPGTMVRQRAAGWLRPHYAQTGRDADLARVLLVELEAVKTAPDRVARHLQIADLYEKLGDPASALEQVGLAMVLDPGDEARRVRLAELAERTGRLERLADLLAAAADACDGEPLRIALRMQAAAVRADRIGDAAGAIALLSAVLAAPETSGPDRLAAARKAEPLLEASGRDEERLDVVERIAEVAEDGAARREALGRAAHLATRLGQDDRAIALWERCVAESEQDAEALDGLVELLEARPEPERLAQVLALRAQSTPAPERKRADRVRVAKLLGEALARPEEAIAAWRAIERELGEADDAALALATLLRATLRWSELAELLERRAGRTGDGAPRGELLRQLGDVQREHLGAPDDAVTTYARALAADARNAEARAGLHALAKDEAHRAAAVEVLLAALRSCDDWRAILELTAHRLLAASGDDERRGVLLEAAEIAETRAGDAGLAFEAMRRAFLLSPGDARHAQVGVEMARLAEASGAWSELVAAYREALAGAEGALAAQLRSKIGVALETHLDDPRGALAAYLQAERDGEREGERDGADGERDGIDAESGVAAVRVAGKLAEWDVAARVVVDRSRAKGIAPLEMLDAYERAADASGAWDEAARALTEATSAGGVGGPAGRDLEARIAEWQRDRRGDPDAAQRAFERALSHDETHATLLAALAQLQRRGRGRPLVDTLLRLSRATGGDLALLREAADVARDAVGDRSLARSVLSDLLELTRMRWLESEEVGPPTSEGGEGLAAYAEWALESLARLHDEEGDARAMVDVLVAGGALPFPASTRQDLRRRAARVSLDRLLDSDRAIALYLGLFDEDPHDAEAVDRLAATYAALGRTPELLSLRERQVSAARDSTARIALRLEAARMQGELGDGARAVETLRASLQESPRHEATVEALAAALDAATRTPELRDLLAEQAQLADDEGDTPRAAALWAQAARIAEERLRDLGAAETYHGRVVALEARAESFDALARLATSRQDPVAAAEWLERLLEVVAPERRVASELRLADALMESGLGLRAAERLELALATAPDAERLRERLAALYREQGQWARLAQLVAGSAGHAPDKSTRMARLLEAAHLFAERCGQPELAIPLLEQASDLAPDDPRVRLALADALASARRFDDARAILQAMIDAFGGRRPKERAPVHYQIARLELAMGNRARALVELDTATRVDPQNPEILRTLAELARDDGQHDRAEKSYRALLVVLRRREEGGESQSIARSEVLLELSAIALRQGERVRAREVLESALEAAGRSEFEQDRLEGKLRARGDHETLVRVLEAKLARLGESPAAARTLSELAEVLSDRLQRPEHALPVRLRALAIDPRSAPAHDAALVLARAVGGVERYVEGAGALVDRALEADDVELACALLVRLGGVAEQDLRDDGRSAALYERAVELGLRTPEVLRALDHVYDRLKDVDRQARVLAMRVEVEAVEGASGAASDAIYRLAALRLASEATLDEGVAMMQAALDRDPQLDRAEQGLRRALELGPRHLRALALYEYVGRHPGHERTLFHALELRSRLPGGDVDTVREAVEIAVRIGDPAMAESLLERFVEGEQTATQNVAHLAWALGALASLREAAGDLRRAVELKKGAAHLADPEIARKLSFEVARLAADQLGDLALAAETYEALHQADPADREAWEPLVAVYRRMDETRKLADLLGTVVEFVDDRSERGRLRLERVRTMMRGLTLADADAAPLLREIVDEDATQVESALMLAAILERTGAEDELAALLAAQIEAAKDRGDAASIGSLALRLGRLVERTDRMQARNVYYTGLDWEPAGRELLDALARLLDGDEDAAERADLLERRLAVEQGPAAEAMALSLAAARRELGDAAAAERAIELGFRAHPASAELRDRLEAAYRERREWRKLAELCILDASARADVGERVARLREAAVLLRTELELPREAAEALLLARQAAPEDGSILRDLVEMRVEAGDPAGAVAELSSAIESAGSDGEACAVLLAARANVRSSVRDEDGALEDRESAFVIDRAAHALALTRQLERSRSAAAERGDAVAVRRLRLRQAEVLPYAGGVDGARAILGELARQDPKDRGVLRALAGLESALERWDAASAVLRRLVGMEEGEAAVETTLRLADACERAGRPGDARGALERARLVAPEDLAVRDRLERVYEQTGAWHELADLALGDARASGDVAARFALLLRAGTLLLERAGDPGAAVHALEEARALRPADPDCVGRLADAYTLSGRGEEALALLEQMILPSKGKRSKELAPLHLRLARVARTQGDAGGEVRSLVMALECDAQNGPVCSDVAVRAIELDQLDLANRALRSVTLLKTPGPMSKALAYQYMGEIARKQGDPKRALTLLKRALAEDPTLEGARALVDAIERGF
jgi:tetratricopeptide (TPR) repeat protein